MRSKHATWKPVPYTGLHARQPRLAVVLHRNGVPLAPSLQGYFTGNAQGLHGADNRHVGAHLQVRRDGTSEQYVDTDQVIYHAYGASEWAIGVETEDGAHPDDPWTSKQVRGIVKICREFGVPGRLLQESASDGVGWHEQYPSWNRTAHACPGAVREQQIREEILPRLRGLSPKRRHVLRRHLRALKARIKRIRHKLRRHR